MTGMRNTRSGGLGANIDGAAEAQRSATSGACLGEEASGADEWDQPPERCQTGRQQPHTTKSTERRRNPRAGVSRRAEGDQRNGMRRAGTT
eukprot:1158395-Rhodomonas_salina.2